MAPATAGECGRLHAQGGIMRFNAVLAHAEEDGFIALKPETGTTTQGGTINAAWLNPQESTALYLKEFSPESQEKIKKNVS